MSPTPTPAVELRNVAIAGRPGGTLRRVNVAFGPGRFHVLRGGADSATAALFRAASLMGPAAEGEILIRGEPTRSLDEAARAALRDRLCGYIFSSPFLLPALSVVENVAMPLFRISQASPDDARRRTTAVLDFVNLTPDSETAAETLPLAAQFRVAVARALVLDPVVLFAERPDAELNGDELCEFVGLLRRAAAQLGVAVIATTARDFVPERGDRVVDVDDGAFRSDSEVGVPT